MENEPQQNLGKAQRMNGYLEFSLNSNLISFISIGDKRCYFDRFEDTLDVIIEQHIELNGEDGLPDEGPLLLDTNMSLSELISTPSDAKALETVINKIVKCQEIDLGELATEENSCIKHLVEKIDSYNKKQGIKPKPGIFCPILIINRQPSHEEITYKIKRQTKIKDIVSYLDKKAKRKVKPLSIKDQSGYTFTNKDIHTLVSELSIKPTKLIISYPPIITINSNHPIKIHLINSLFNRPEHILKVGPKFTLRDIIKLIMDVTKDKADPLLIQDQQYNTFPQKQWNHPLSSLQLRKPELIFTFAPYTHFECQLTVKDLPNHKVQSFIYKIQKQTTLSDILQFVRQKTKCFGGTFSITDCHGRSYRHIVKKVRLSSLNFQETKLELAYLKPKCLLRSTAMLALRNQLGQAVQMSIQEYFSQQKNRLLQIISYNEIQRSIEQGQISCFKTESNYARLISLKISTQKETLFVECFEQSTFLTTSNEWKPANALKKTDGVLVLDSTCSQVIEGKVVEVKQISIKSEEEIYAFEVVPHHNFFANRVMIHNDDSIQLTAYVFKKGQPTSKELVNCYLNQRLNSIELFRDRVLMIGGGLVLDVSRTCGDYQLETFGSIFVFEEGETNFQPKFVISEWGSKVYQYGEVTDFQKKKWESDYLALHESRIIELNNLQQFRNNDRPLNLLVCPRINLQKLYYTFTIRAKYQDNQEEALEEFDYVQIPTEILNREGKQLNDPKDIKPIYLYTTNYFYSDLNLFLRTKNKSNYSPEELTKWYSLTNCIVSKLQKLKNFSGTVYRGISNICIDKAFRIKQNSEKEQYLILDGFSSTTLDPDVAENFAKREGGKGAILKLIVQSGKLIEEYSSYYKTEKEVLLPPFIYFRIIGYNLEAEIQEMTLEQIPFPQTTQPNLIFWVDDNPKQQENVELLKRFQNSDIQVVQVTSTKLMQIILRDFLALIQAMGKKVVILSDMSRIERGIENSQAGDDLFKLIYDDYGKSTRAFIFAGHEVISREQIEIEGLNTGIWQVYYDVDVLVNEIMLEFKTQ